MGLITLALSLILYVQDAIAATEPPFELPSKDEIRKLQTAIIYTRLGEIHIQLHPEDAPWHVANLKFRADRGLYKGSIFNHFEPNYIIQGGEHSKKSAKPTYFLLPEFTGFKHEPGAVGMARIPDPENPERLSHPRQFYIMLSNAVHMDGQYTIFGHVTKGMDLVEQLREEDKIVDIKVFVRSIQRNY